MKCMIADLRAASRRHAERAAAYRMAGERDLARAHDALAAEMHHAADRIEALEAKLAAARPAPIKFRRIATRADGQPAYRSVA